MAIHTTHGYTISDKNAKMDDICSFSVTVGVTCPKDVPCRGKCYARRMVNRRDNLAISYNRNYARLTADGGYSALVEDLSEVINDKRLGYFRFNVGGDIFSVEYALAIIEIANRCPRTDILVYTKQYDNIETARKLKGFPKNLHVYLSVWGAYFPRMEIRSNKNDYLIAHFQDKKNLMLITDKTSETCPSSCKHCKRCFLGLGNVTFKEH